MKNRCVLAGPVLALALQSALANTSADEARLLATLKRTYPATTFTSVAASEVPGIYEVWMGPNVAFVSRNRLGRPPKRWRAQTSRSTSEGFRCRTP